MFCFINNLYFFFEFIYGMVFVNKLVLIIDCFFFMNGGIVLLLMEEILLLVWYVINGLYYLNVWDWKGDF